MIIQQPTIRTRSVTPRRIAKTGRARHAPRGGLAPLEMALALPILLFVFALIVNAGYSGTWKLRSLGIARETAWSARTPRDANKPPPEYWSDFWQLPSPTTQRQGLPPIESLDPQSVDLPVVRGAKMGSLDVDRDLLDPARGSYQGQSTTTRPFPLLPDGLGSIRYTPDHQLLDDSFPYWNTGLSNNIQRRTKVLYQMDTEFGGQWQAYLESAAFAVQLVKHLLNTSNLLPLGHFRPDGQNYRDPDSERLIWVSCDGTTYSPGSPGFMPRIGYFNSLDFNSVYSTQVEPLIKKILDNEVQSGDPSLPYSLAGSYINFFNRAEEIVRQDIARIDLQIASLELAIELAIQNKQTAELAILRSRLNDWQACRANSEAELARRVAELGPKKAELQSFRSQF